MGLVCISSLLSLRRSHVHAHVDMNNALSFVLNSSNFYISLPNIIIESPKRGSAMPR
jgi:hypothetical protein